MIIDEESYLKHYGILRRSGRYPWGSGGHSEQNHRSFLGMVEAMRAEGMSDAEIAKGFGVDLSTRDFIAMRTIAKAEIKAADIARAKQLRNDRGMSYQAIADQMGLAGESSVRALLAEGANKRAEDIRAASDMLKEQIADGGYLDVGVGNEHYVGMSRTQLDAVLGGLKNEGYEVINVQIDQVGGTGKTITKVLAPEGTEYKDIVSDMDSIKSIAVKLEDGAYVAPEPPTSIDGSRVQVVYGPDGGAEADGAIYIRPGVDDLDLGGANYAQVRIGVDDTHYLKGVAIYKDDMPAGVDVIFNTNKNDTGNPKDSMKAMKYMPETDSSGAVVTDSEGNTVYSNRVDVENPFGATIKPGGQRGVLNVVNEEGDWSDWSNTLASQMLAKQKPTVAKEQLDKLYSRKRQELDEIMELTNPSVRKKLLESYSDGVDSSAVHLEAAAMDRQATQVILPVNSMKDTEIYAPNFRNGERVALIRYPHGGTFEIPELIVNNKQPEAKSLLKNAQDAVAINSRVAERLSGADFDGDTVLVIPNGSGKIKSSPALDGLKNFDPKERYPSYEGMVPMTSRQTQQEMGNVSNLITDMTIKGANTHEIASAVRHSMVVIDAEKHELNYKQSYIDNGIANLKAKYQGSSNSGASTLLSRSTSEVRVNKRQMGYRVDPDTGEKIFRETGEGWTTTKTNKRTGEVTEKFNPLTSKSTRGAEAKDAHTLSSGTKIEGIYADHSNRLKALANESRKAMVNTKSVPYSPSARKIYQSEVNSLDAKLNVALKNAPRERQAQLIANATVKQKRDANPNMSNAERKKIDAQAINTARQRVGARKERVDITPREWEAIQSGAVSGSKLTQILNNTDLDTVKKYATPRQNPVMTDAKMSRARALLASGKTNAEVADILGVAPSTLSSSMK